MILAMSWRSVKAHKLRSLLNALGIVLGVGLIFAVISL